MLCEKDWVDILSALLAPIIAVIAVGIAVLQWKINRNRLKHELFDRRYEQYEAVRKFLASIMTSGQSKIEAQQEYLICTSGIEFTYSKELSEYLNENIWRPSIDLECTQAELNSLASSEERSHLARKAAELKKKLFKEMEDIDDVFRPYLHLTH
ncbi:hypothetical protein [Thalassolituus oleivorans]|uniref:hypothetical protein n=1 Tax=Thalassolituus oleivorans TaxID=187493 RepID=UPI0023F38DB0|nr:hypothetical protein [Thalassolituus oleivorans]